MEPMKILMIEDNPGDARLIQDMLADVRNIEFALDWKQTLTGGLESLRENKYDAVLLDLGLPDSPQRSASFTRVQTVAPSLPRNPLGAHPGDARYGDGSDQSDEV